MKYQVTILPVAKADINAAAKWIRRFDSIVQNILLDKKV